MRTRFASTVALFALGFGFPASAGAGETFKTERGKEYRDCEVIGKDPHGVTFRHSGGIAKLAFADLSDGAQKRFNYDKAEAKRFVDSRRPKPVVHQPRPAVASNNVRIGALAAYPRGRHIRNPYLLSGPLHNPVAAYGASYGGFVQPYFSGSFGTPALVTTFPGGFFTPNTLRVSAKPILDSPVATGMSSYSQFRDARASAVRAAVLATPRSRGATVRSGRKR